MTYQVASNNSIDAIRLKNHLCSHSINQHLLNSNIGKVLRNLRGNLIPKNHAVPLRIALGDHSQMLSGSLLRNLKREPNKSANSVTSEDGDFCGNFPGVTAV
jgi:hypothetical protein